MSDSAGTAPKDGLRASNPLAWLVACEQIRQLASRYAVAMGRRDFVGLAELFVADVRVRSESGRQALAADFERQVASLGRSILHVTNHVIDVADGYHASGVVGTRAELEIGNEWVVQMIEYDDTYRCVDGEWLFVRRQHRLWYGAPVGANPLDLPLANWPDNAVGLGDLP